MRILHVFHNGNLHNGVDQTTLTLARALLKKGVDLAALVPEAGEVTDALDGLGVHYWLMPIHCCTSPAWRAELRYLRESGIRAQFLLGLLQQERFDLVHLNTGHLLDAALAAALAEVPAVWHIHSPFENDYERYQRFLSAETYAWVLGALGSRVIAVSDDVATSVQAHVSMDRVRTLYNGIDVDALRESAQQPGGDLRSELGLPSSARLVSGVGRISAQKDFATFVRVAEQVVERHSDAYFLIAGPPNDRELNQALTKQVQTDALRGRVLLLGKRQDVPRLLQQSNLFLSTAIFEGHPLTTLEAMALGCPVVAMSCVGLRECVEDGEDGLLVPLGDIDAAAVAVSRVLTDQELARALARGGQRTVEQRFSSADYAERFLEIGQEAIQAGPSPVESGAVGLVRGLLEQVGQASLRIDTLDRPAGLAERLGRKVDRWMAALR